MRLYKGHLLGIGLLIWIIFVVGATAFAQIAAPHNRITQAVSDRNRVTLTGNVHPLARTEFDRGTAPDSLPAERMLLVLRRGEDQQTALDKLIQDQQTPSSPSYHKWLTPSEFGQMFGPSDADIAAVTNWLTSQGFQVTKVGAGRTAIEFSGTAGQIRTAFHTALHKYVVNGEEHWANVSDPQIPAALAPVVRNIASLNSFRKKPTSHGVIDAHRSLSDGVTPDLTITCSDGLKCYGVGPADFATIYNVQPMWMQGVDGTGQSIAIVGRTNINIQDVQDFRNLFGLPANDPQIILNGPDPGIVSDEEQMEASLDVQWSGAVAKNATVKFVVSESTDVVDGIDLSAFYIVDNNLAPVMSESFGGCEAQASSGYAGWLAALWEQAAAQGITVLVSTGDTGSAGCEDQNLSAIANTGLAVNILASTPFNVAVGGTDFDQNSSNYSTYWNSTSAPGTGQSAKTYIPETTWNESCAAGATGCSSPNVVAGSGGASILFSRPSWQTGVGVPNDNHRDLPDVSLFASTVSAHRSGYIVCQSDGTHSCAQGYFHLVGGTSAAAPSFAGIMAMVVQSQANSTSSGRQGNANYTFYNLAAQQNATNLGNCNSTGVLQGNPCVFYDITKGDISVPCVIGSSSCGSNGFLVDSVNNPAWATTTGYDLATGLGSVNVANLIAKWASANYRPTTTTITSLTPTSTTHGQAVNVQVSVVPSSGSGTPTGDISLIANMGNDQYGKPITARIDGFTLSEGVAGGQTSLLPGGTYNVTARYGGDGTFAASDSAPVQVTVGKEASKTTAGVITYDLNTGNVTSYQASTATYGSPYILEINVANSTASSPCYKTNIVLCPSGPVALTDNGAPLDGGSFSLNSFGFADDQKIQLAPGQHNITASYAGDNSFQASSGSTSINITKAVTTIGTPSADGSASVGQNVNILVTVGTISNGAAPSGTVTFYDGGTALSGSVSYSGTEGVSAPASLVATITTSFSGAGTHAITAKYNGDANYAASPTSGSTNIQVSGSATNDFNFGAAPPANVTVTKGQSGTSTVTIGSVGSYAGTVALTCGVAPVVSEGPVCGLSQSSVTVTANGTVTATATITTTAAHQISARMRGAGWLGGVFAFGLVGIVGRKRKLTTMLVVLIASMILVGGLASCGGGGGSATTPPPTSDPGTPAGTYTVTVTGTAQINGSAVNHTTSFNVVVQ